MKCDQFRDALRAVQTWDRPDDELPAALRQHANGCVACSDEWDRVHRLQAALGALSHESSISAPPALERRLLEAFRAHHQQLVPKMPQSSGSWVWLQMAAAVVLAVGAAWWYVARPTAPSANGAHPEAQSSRPALNGVSSQQVAPVRTDRGHERQAAPEAQQSARATTPTPATTPPDMGPSDVVDRDPDGVLADFVPLPYGAIPTDDDVHVVEIDVPRDALYDFGSAVQSGSATNDLVTADLLIGDDGAPRAFRIVEPTATEVALERQQSPFGARSPRP